MSLFDFSPVTPFSEGQIAEVEAFHKFASEVAETQTGDDWDYRQPSVRAVEEWAQELAEQGIFYEDGGYVKRS